ncbi:MAG TPA: hypothetical protein VIK30_15355, partial [Polyangia bacterium]
APAPPAGYAPPTTAPAPPAGYAPQVPQAGTSPPPPPQAGSEQQVPPPGYAPGYGPPAYPPPPRGYAPGSYYPPGYAPVGYGPPPNLHDGFYLHMQIGGGGTRVSGTDAFGESVKISGGSLSIGIALGGAITPNLIVFGTLFFSGLGMPDVSVGGFASGTSNGSAVVTGIGPGIAYYLEPFNVYFSGTLGAMAFEMDDVNGNAIYQTKAGIGCQILVGKEWWISQDWGLGVAGEFVGASMKDKSDNGITWSATAFSLLFSTTYN